MYDLIIVGGGPAGITAGIYSARKKLKTLLVAKDLLGQTGEAGFIENWPGESRITGPELMMKFEKHLKEYDIDIKEDRVVSVDKTTEGFVVKSEVEVFNSKAVIVATGRKPKRLGVTGEDRFVGKGVVYCTTCDAPFFADKKVVVVGGGDSGFKSALELTDHTDDIFIFEVASEIKAEEMLQDRVKEKGIKVFLNRKVREIKGNNFLEEIVYEDPDGESSMKIDGLFVQIGAVPISGFLGDLVDLNPLGEVEIDSKTFQTKTEGLFAAGDVTDVSQKQIVIAAGEGAKASLSAYSFLKR